MTSKAGGFLNSALAFASAELLTAALHETGHGLAAQALGFAPRIYAFYENNPTGTPAQSLIILAAGPITSLILGIAFLLWYRAGSARYSFGRLLLFWLAWLGIMQFVNYLIVTPWMTAGDTSQIADLLHWSTLPRYAVALVGIIALFSLTGLAAQTMYALATQDAPIDTPRDRRRYIMRGFYLPLLAGTVLTAPGGIGGLPMVVGLGMLGTLGNIDVIAFALYRTGREPKVPPGRSAAPALAPAAIVLYIAVVASYIFVLARGLPV